MKARIPLHNDPWPETHGNMVNHYCPLAGHSFDGTWEHPQTCRSELLCLSLFSALHWRFRRWRHFLGGLASLWAWCPRGPFLSPLSLIWLRRLLNARVLKSKDFLQGSWHFACLMVLLSSTHTLCHRNCHWKEGRSRRHNTHDTQDKRAVTTHTQQIYWKDRIVGLFIFFNRRIWRQTYFYHNPFNPHQWSKAIFSFQPVSSCG